MEIIGKKVKNSEGTVPDRMEYRKEKTERET
jgi:hypothetical protein